jgi:hypothetical protein
MDRELAQMLNCDFAERELHRLEPLFEETRERVSSTWLAHGNKGMDLSRMNAGLFCCRIQANILRIDRGVVPSLKREDHPVLHPRNSE